MTSTLRTLSSANIRTATRYDECAVRRVLAEAYREFESAIPPALYAAYVGDLLNLDARRADTVLLVAEVDGAVVGAVSYYPYAAKAGVGWPAAWAGFPRSASILGSEGAASGGH